MGDGDFGWVLVFGGGYIGGFVIEDRAVDRGFDGVSLSFFAERFEFGFSFAVLFLCRRVILEIIFSVVDF